MVVNLDVNTDGEMVNEDVGPDYRDNYIRINAPALEGKTPVTVIHDTTEVNFLFSLFCSVIENYVLYILLLTWIQIKRNNSWYFPGYNSVQTSWSLFLLNGEFVYSTNMEHWIMVYMY